MQTAAFRRHAAVPKTNQCNARRPGLYQTLWSPVSPRDRQALRQIASTADLLHVDGQAFLLIPAPPRLLETLAAFEAELEDMEPDSDAEEDDAREDDDQDEGVDDEGEACNDRLTPAQYAEQGPTQRRQMALLGYVVA